MSSRIHHIAIVAGAAVTANCVLAQLRAPSVVRSALIDVCTGAYIDLST